MFSRKVIGVVVQRTKEMARTRSKSSSVTIKKKPNKKEEVSRKKELLENVLNAKISIPSDLKLPDEFIKFHDEEFIKGIEYILSKDSTLYPAITCSNFKSFPREVKNDLKEEEEVIRSYWYSLICSVIGQQISGHAAKSVENKFRNLFEGQPSAKETVLKPAEELKAAGLSNQKLGYVYDISHAFNDETNPLTKLEFYKKSSSDEIIEELVKLKGIGSWSAKMFLFFTLRELDIFAEDDLGVARGAARYWELRPESLKQIKQEVNLIEEFKKLLKRKGKFENKNTKRDWIAHHDQYVKYLGLTFKPYQLIFMLVMWRLSSTNVDVLENTGTR
ncbi:DNA glycosylase [Hyphopichia burtonii NRRL Y-1933]|uniref:DNA glycosylase n=1 Tax=Hyphopichia burtonii NRRL Y-1933 TaxID=984485 RepID=A0A1E4RM36_9ASCO|nr:DNA glycosylase [Hyphopichia burtonii NRRL Y-1933]ODV68330.1 DNA glycosylase [Hyphopichia burtonii NRRL Y-1933]